MANMIRIVRSSVETRNPPRDLRLPCQEFYSLTSEWEEAEGRRKWVWKEVENTC
jgi:hypothetical protein